MITNELRFVKQADYPELVNLYHLARTALSGQDDSKYQRMLWASKEFAKTHTYVTATGAYKDLETNLRDINMLIRGKVKFVSPEYAFHFI